MDPLSNYVVLKSSDVDEVEEMISHLSTPFKMNIKGDHSGFDTRIAVADVGDVRIMHSSFGEVGIEIASEGETDDGLLLFLPTVGGGSITHLKKEWEYSEHQGIFRDLGRHSVAYQENFHTYAIPLSKKKLREHALRLGGDKLSLVPLEFDPAADFSSEGGLLLRQTLEFTAQAMDGPLRNMDGELIKSQMSDLIMTQILTQLASTVQDRLNGREVSNILPRSVKRAQDYIHAHPANKLDMSTLAEVAGCSYRTLQRGFLDAFDATPQQYIRKIRLIEVRRELLSSGPKDNVANIARRWGFAHMGRFAQEYAKEFGEFPSET